MNAPADLLAQMPRGLADAVHDAQSVFRSVLEALSRPGRLQTLAAADGLQPPAPLSRGVSALLLTLLDSETSLHLSPGLASDAAWMYCRFHTGVQRRDDSLGADFAATRADTAQWSGLRLGSDEMPQLGATLIVDCPSLAVDRQTHLTLRGPGIEHETRMGLCGLPASFWQQRIAMQALFPRGADLLLVCGTQLLGVPRSTSLRLEA